MTSDVELLPSSVAAHVKAYARVCVARSAAVKDAEIEGLRAEVERLTFEMGCLQQQYDERTAYMIVHRGSALVCSDAVRSAYSDEHHRAERLAEALRMMVEMMEMNGFGKGAAMDTARAAIAKDIGGAE